MMLARWVLPGWETCNHVVVPPARGGLGLIRSSCLQFKGATE